MESVGRYDKSEIDLFPQMLAHLIEELERHAEYPEDVLGGVFHELELHNKYNGQFFTPQHICDMMGMIVLGDGPSGETGRDFEHVGEPCAGSGAMILGFARVMVKNKRDFHREMVVTATDVDIKCVWMTYLQLALYGIPAVVIHGNSISLEEWSRWYTPIYMFDDWVWRQTCGNLNKHYPEDEAIKRATNPMYAAIRDAEALMNTAPEQAEMPSEAPAAAEPTQFNVNLRENDSGQLRFEF